MSADTIDVAAAGPRRSALWTAIRRNPTITIGLAIMLALVAIAVFAP